MSNENGMQKNASVVIGEFQEWRYQMEIGIRRLRHAGLKFDKYNVFHILQNLITETWRAYPRTLSYATTGYIVYKLIYQPWIAPLFT